VGMIEPEFEVLDVEDMWKWNRLNLSGWPWQIDTSMLRISLMMWDGMIAALGNRLMSILGNIFTRSRTSELGVREACHSTWCIFGRR
jgi:hypothetical protein